MSLSRGTVPNPSTPGLIGQLTEGSQKSPLQNGLKRRTLRASTIPWLPELRKPVFHLPVDSGSRPRADRCLRQDEDFPLFRPRGMTRAKKSRGKRICSFPSPKNAAILPRTVFTYSKEIVAWSQIMLNLNIQQSELS
jgi:hypothetical protein